MNKSIVFSNRYNRIAQRYMGSKARFLREIVAPAAQGKKPYRAADAIIEPYAGAAHFSLLMMASTPALRPDHVFWGESDPSLLVVYDAIRAGLTEPVEAHIEHWKERFKKAAGEGQEQLDIVWASLKRIVQSAFDLFTVTINNPAALAKTAAASLVMRKLTQGGMIRTNSKGRIMISLVNGQLKSLFRWKYQLPSFQVPVTISYTADLCLEAFRRDRTIETAEALIDPPYWSLNRNSTATYPYHKPHAEETFWMGIRTLEKCLQDRRIVRIVICNYYSERMDTALREAAGDYGQTLTCNQTGELTTVQNKHETTTKQPQGIWTLERI